MASAGVAKSVNSSRISNINRMVHWLKAHNDAGDLFFEDGKLFDGIYAHIKTSAHRSSFDEDTLLRCEEMISKLYTAYVAYVSLRAFGIPTDEFKRSDSLLPHAEQMTKMLRTRESINGRLRTMPLPPSTIPKVVPSTPLRMPTTLTPQQKLNAIAARVQKNPALQASLPPKFFYDSSNRHPTNTFKIDEINRVYKLMYPHHGGRKTHRKRVVRKTRSMKKIHFMNL